MGETAMHRGGTQDSGGSPFKENHLEGSHPSIISPIVRVMICCSFFNCSRLHSELVLLSPPEMRLYNSQETVIQGFSTQHLVSKISYSELSSLSPSEFII